MLNRIPDVEVHVFGRAGLWVPYEKARRFEEVVTGFLTAGS
jgi:2-hydroxy-6-oxonona-2,4-dienedioate hydrolase/4,5:9,10-diseco-3-hydroxy-5,9,17-trioxoandrosta-1(10),2-diene-4-oate hydrolase